VTVLAYIPDLMDRSRVSAAVEGVEFVKAPGDVSRAEAGDVVVVDLGRPGALEAVADLGPGVRSIGFASHVDRSLMERAEQAGVGEVLPRSRFFASMAVMLAGGTD
jgi:DNA-binding NarL/FixJ family response regulator